MLLRLGWLPRTDDTMEGKVLLPPSMCHGAKCVIEQALAT